MITSAWIDTETTGIDPRDSGAFEVALLIYKGPQCVYEKLYHLNPLSDEVKWGQEAYQVNGVTEEIIRSYPPLEKVVPEIVADLEQFLPPEKYAFAGYNCGFDFSHIGALLYRRGFYITDLFSKHLIDVYELVKKAAGMGLLPKTPNQKLETMAKALKIDHGIAHTAMDDIKATRRIYETIYYLEKGAKMIYGTFLDARDDFSREIGFLSTAISDDETRLAMCYILLYTSQRYIAQSNGSPLPGAVSCYYWDR
jgi:DNA polymerase III epsilon subunit-like protein